MKTCKEICEELDRVIDGEVNSLERLSFALHMAMCGPCEQYFLQYKTARDAAEGLDGKLPPDFDKVMGRIVEAALAKGKGDG